MELFDDHSKLASSGIRLERLEIQNWGTFDRDIFVLNFNGEPALLVGKNGTGKTTISDAILTLLVENNRNYNVSASSYGSRKGRNETSYIKGAFKEVSQEGQIQSTPAYLRPSEGTLSVLLAVFRNYTSGKCLSVAQVMYMGSGDRKRYYLYSEDTKSIQEHLSKFKDLRAIKPELKRRGFTVTETVGAYFEKIRSWCGMRPKALDVFNQTVAVKEIENLNSFIRRYMLDAKDYESQVKEITSHYKDLDTAYRQIIHSESQLEHLTPIEIKGEVYENTKAATLALKEREKVRDYFFKERQEATFHTAIEKAKFEINNKQKEKVAKEAEEEDINRQIIDLKVEKQNKGSLLTKLESDLGKQTIHLSDCKSRLKDFKRALAALEIKERPSDYNTFNEIVDQVRSIHSKAPEEGKKARSDALKCSKRLDLLRDQLKTEDAHLRELQGTKSNMDPALRELRARMCEALSLDPTRLPFAAELMQVKDDESKWQLAIELVLKGFGKTLLVPTDLHPAIVEYAERNKLKNKAGKGMLLEYEKVDPNDQIGMRRENPSSNDFIAQKLSYKLTHSFGAWIMREVRDRFPIKCIEGIDAFRSHHGRAVTIEGQVRFDNGRIRKDDRESSRNSKNFNLGWDNEQKREKLTQSINDLKQEIAELEKTEQSLDERETFWRDVKHHGNTVLSVSLWSEIDTAPIEKRIETLEDQITEFKAKNTDIAELDQRINDAENEQRTLKRSIESFATDCAKLEQDSEGWENSHILAKRSKMLLSTPTPEQLEATQEHYRSRYMMTIDTIMEDDRNSREALEIEIRAAEKKEEKLSSEIEKAMTRFLEAFKADGFWQQLSADIGYLAAFRKEYNKINGDGLPRHKENFRTMARDRLYNDLGQLNHELRNADKEMKSRIGEINQALHDIEYNPGSYTRLRYVKAKFQQRDKLQSYLKDALNNSLGGQRTFEEAESFFKTIEPFINDLTSDDGWAKTACDVRNWYDFAADENNKHDDSEIRTFRSTETSSGGEKAKLAFTILVAALVYQYDLDPNNPSEQKFRFAVIDEAFAKVDDVYATYVLNLFESFGLQTMIVAPLDPKSLIVVPYMDYYVMTVKSTGEDGKDRSRILTMTKELIQQKMRQAKKAEADKATSK